LREKKKEANSRTFNKNQNTKTVKINLQNLQKK